jgi:hypothetical protein
LALFGHGAMSDLSPLSGVKRKLDFGAVRAAFDPPRSCGRSKISQAIIPVIWYSYQTAHIYHFARRSGVAA